MIQKEEALREGTLIIATKGNATAAVLVYRGRIVDCAPILRKILYGFTALNAAERLVEKGWRVVRERADGRASALD